MRVTELIHDQLGKMTRSERRVATYVLGHMTDIAFQTLEELAEQTEVSTTSVLRFCRCLGYDGFKQFQQSVRGDLKYSPDLLDKFQRTFDRQLEDTLLAQTIQQGILCIQQTFQELPFDSVAEAQRLLTEGRRVYTFGMRESHALAEYLYTRLLTVRPDVFLHRDGYWGNVENLLELTGEDVFVVYLFHRYTRQTIDLLELLKQQGVKVILVTSPPMDSVARLADVLLPCRVDANGIKNSALAPICLADYLCNAIAVDGGEKILKRMKQSEELFRTSGMLDE